MPSQSQSTTETKTTFLRSQIRLLSAPLHPSPTHPSTPSDVLPQKPLDETLTKLNNKIKAHNRLVFSVPSQRHVAEQINALYWNEVTSSPPTISPHIAGEGESESESEIQLQRSTDLSSQPTISSLQDPTFEELLPVEKREVFREKRAKLVELARRRDEVQGKVQAYRKLRELLVPFEDTGEVQKNLVGRDGELGREMVRLRGLLARVNKGLDGGRDHGVVGGRREVVELDERAKLARVMGLG